MDPFDAPPSTPAVSLEPPVDPPAPRRGRTVAIVLGTVGVLGAGIVGISQFAAADEPELTVGAGADRPGIDPVTAADDEPTDDERTDDEPADEPAEEPADDEPDADDEITIQIGDGEPIVIDLGDGGPGGALGGLLDGEAGRELRECLGVPMLDLPPAGDDDAAPGELGDLDLGALFDQFFADGAMADLFGDEELQRWLDELATLADDSELMLDEREWAPGDQVTVAGDDGLTVIDLGDGDATVTIERDGETGDVTISTDGTATTNDLGELFGDLDLGDLDLGELGLPMPPDGGLADGSEVDGSELDGTGLDRIEECLADLEP